MALAHLWLSAYGRAALVLIIAALAGYPICRRAVSGLTAVPLTILVGLGVLGTVVCLLAWFRILYTATVLAVAGLAAAGALIAMRLDRVDPGRALRARPRPRATLVVAVAALGVVLLVFSPLALYPPKDDAALYHLPLAHLLVAGHGLSFDPYVRYSFFPQANESMFAVMTLLGAGQVGPAALEYSVLALGTLTLMLWFIDSDRWAGGGLLAALVLLASPVVIWAGTSAFVDTWTMVFVLGALLLALDAAERRRRPVATLALAGVLLGEAAATKYSGLLFGSLALLAALIVAGGARRFWRGVPVLVVTALAVALPWYAWTIHTTGDPIFPFATSVFGSHSGLWTAHEINHQYIAARAAPPGLGGLLGQDLKYLLGELSYNTGAQRSPLSPWLAVGFLGLLLPAARHDRTFLGLLAAALLSLIASLLLSADPRYLLPAAGVFALLAGLAAHHLLAAIYPRVSRSRRAMRLTPAIYLAAPIVLLWSAAGYAREVVSSGLPPESSAAIRSFLVDHVPCYTAVEYLNEHAGANYRAWDQGCEKATFYARGRLIGDAFGAGSWYRILDSGRGGSVSLPPPETLRKRLAPLSVGWLVIPTTLLRDPRALEAGGRFRPVATIGDMQILRIAG